MRLSRRAALGGALGVSALGAVAYSQTGNPRLRSGAWNPRDIEVRAAPLSRFSIAEPEARRFGQLHFLSGLALSSPDPNFGGFSGLFMPPGGRDLVALSDNAYWLTGRLETAADGAMSALAQTRLAPLLGANGRPLQWVGRWDSEALAIAPNGTAYIGFERVGEIYRCDFGKEGTAARATLVEAPAWLRKLPDNKGIEALAVAPPASPVAGALIMIAERSHGRAAYTVGTMIGGPRPGDFRFARRDDFDVSDCAFLPGGDLLVLERRFRWSDGVAIRLRRVAAGELRPGATLQGVNIFEATMAHEIDNMEGLAIHADAQGRTILTMISDDNFSMIQRTLLLQFRLIE
ncbi:MAG: esterase-like activity of phytase family protein [Methylobacteriaceae bacterium]|nr:esterase-like activity of phytase family protein [Methylobacteriaceae bacterium]